MTSLELRATMVLLLTETSGTWAAGVEASLPANANNTSAGLGSVSCASAGNCTAVGYYEDSSGHQQGLLLSETSGTWATGVEASLPANAGTNPNATSYLGVVRLGGELRRRRPLRRQLGPLTGAAVERDVGHVGDRRRGVAARKRRHEPEDAGLDSVSCASAGNCTAVGGYTDSSGHEQGLLLGTAPSAASALALIGQPDLQRRARHRQAELRALGAPTLPGDRDADHDRDDPGRPARRAQREHQAQVAGRSSSPRRG